MGAGYGDRGKEGNMFDKFGEFDSAEEINRAAAAQKEEGDVEALYDLAEENGIDREDVEDYLDGRTEELVNPLTAAYGKLDMEERELKPYGIMKDWLQYIRVQCVENPDMAAGVRKKGKKVNRCIGELLKWSFQNAKEIPKDITEAAGITGAKVKLGIPCMEQAKQIIREYYTEGQE